MFSGLREKKMHREDVSMRMVNGETDRICARIMNTNDTIENYATKSANILKKYFRCNCLLLLNSVGRMGVDSHIFQSIA